MLFSHPLNGIECLDRTAAAVAVNLYTVNHIKAFAIVFLHRKSERQRVLKFFRTRPLSRSHLQTQSGCI